MKIAYTLLFMLVYTFLGPTVNAQSSTVEIEFNNDFNLVFIPIQYEGETQYLILDSGFEFSLLNEPIISANNTIENRSNGFGRVNNFRFMINDLNVTLQSARTIDFSLVKIEEIIGKSVMGILGYDFFQKYLITIDYEHSLLSIYPPDSSPTIEGEVIPLELEQNFPFVYGTIIDGKHKEGVRLLLDTGSLNFFSLDKNFLDQKNIGTTKRKLGFKTLGIQPGKGKLFMIDGFEIGSHTFNNIVTSHGETGFNQTDLRHEGNLGSDFFHRFTVTFDYQNKRLILSPNKFYSTEIGFDFFGGQFSLRNGAVYVEHVIESSPAEQMGLKEGDQILAIDDTNIDELGLSGLYRLFSMNGKTYTVRFARNGIIQKAAPVTLRQFLSP